MTADGGATDGPGRPEDPDADPAAVEVRSAPDALRLRLAAFGLIGSLLGAVAGLVLRYPLVTVLLLVVAATAAVNIGVLLKRR